MIIFKSLIMFDTETTNIPKWDHNTTKITELAFLGCEISHVKESASLPRVLHKLVLCLNPNKMIHPGAAETSGLNNELLENLPPFRTEDADMLKNFISRLPPPVVVVAHNGDNFDFPILRRILENLRSNLPNDVYCADSLKAFWKLLPKKVDFPNSFPCSVQTKPQSGELTPKSQKTIPTNSLNYKQNEVIEIYKTITPAVRRELFPESPNSKLLGYNSSGIFTPIQDTEKSLISYKLKDIYYYLHNTKFPDAHRAEEDCKALLSCIIRCHGFYNWLNEFAVPFNSIPPLF